MSTDSFISWAKPDFWGNELKYITEALTSTWISGGPFVDRFEKEFAEYSNVKYAVTASNGTTALHMAYLAIGLNSEDEVIVPGFAFMGAANMVMYMGAKLVFADVDPQTWCITAETIEKCLSPRTKLIVPVHTYGNVCDMASIMQLANNHKITVIEDTAEAFASKYKGKLAGTFAPLGTYSFQATKTITTGEGGMVITDDDELYDRMTLYRSHGMRRKRYYWHDLAGHNFRLTNLQAAMGVAQMEKLPAIIQERKRVHKRYEELLAGNTGVTLQNYLPEVDGVLWAVALRLDPKAYSQGRDSVIQQMKDRNIETRPGFVAPRFMGHLYDSPRLPVTEELSEQVISLPTYPTLEDEQIAFICNHLKTLKG